MSFTIITDTASNLESKYTDELNIEVVRMHYCIEDKDYLVYNDWSNYNVDDFYDYIRKGNRVFTSQVDFEQYKDLYVKSLKEGKDVLVLACGSAFSATIDVARHAKEEALKEYPNGRIEVIDADGACYSFGMWVMECAKMRNEGKSFDEVFTWANENKRSFLEIGYCDELKYLKRAGRINAAAAFFGTLVGIKPIIIYDETGHNTAFEKTAGKKQANQRCADYIKKYGRFDYFKTIYVAHSNSLELANQVVETLKQTLNDDSITYHIQEITAVIGASVGPGTIIIDFYGDSSMRKLV